MNRPSISNVVEHLVVTEAARLGKQDLTHA